MHAEDPFDLKRFLQAQESTYDRALAELRAGRKTSHWMWFVFPQIDGLGRSPMARHYAIKSLAEASAYLAHEILGARLRECTAALLVLKGLTPSEIFGRPDDMKLLSSMTLFEHAAQTAAGEDGSLFSAAIEQFYAGRRDSRTLDILDANRA